MYFNGVYVDNANHFKVLKNDYINQQKNFQFKLKRNEQEVEVELEWDKPLGISIINVDNSISTGNNMYIIEEKYATGRGVASFVFGLGVLQILIGCFFALIASQNPENLIFNLSILSSLIVSGTMFLLFSKIAHAIFDIAVHTQIKQQ